MAINRNSRRPQYDEVPIAEGSASGTNRRGETVGGLSAPSGSSLNVDSDWRNILSKLGTGADFTQLLAQLGIGGIDPKDAAVHDWNSELLKQILQYYLTQEQRSYDQILWNQQNLYDSPTNKLARLMGAGISRDAAIQMLSGGAGGSGAAVPYGITGNQASLLPASQSYANDVSAKASIANTVIGGLSAISGLVSLGFSIPQAIRQTAALGMQNFMSQKAMIGLQAADDVLGALQSAVDIGALSTQDMDGFSNATDALNYIYDHKDTNAFKGIVSSGAFANVYGSKYGREMFTNAWNSVRQSKDAGTLLDEYIKQNEAHTRLANYDADKAYYEVDYAIGELAKQDVEIQNLWNDVWLGNINIEIAGKELDLKKYEANQAKTFNDIFDVTYNQSGDTPDTRNLGRGARYIAYAQWDELNRMFQKAFAMSGTAERRDSWERFYLNNADALKLMAGIKLQMTQNQSNAMNPDLHPNLAALISLYQIGNLTGAFDVIGFGADVAKDIMLIDKLGKKP